ncbi:MAG: hypothetical protein J4F47_08935 [Alphaproteobacteria bacterium]|nr:hypothetical protein [Alphaproteobacteria bacterium]
MALRLEMAGWSNAELWLRRQTTYDLVQARKDQDRIRASDTGRSPSFEHPEIIAEVWARPAPPGIPVPTPIAPHRGAGCRHQR